MRTTLSRPQCLLWALMAVSAAACGTQNTITDPVFTVGASTAATAPHLMARASPHQAGR